MERVEKTQTDRLHLAINVFKMLRNFFFGLRVNFVLTSDPVENKRRKWFRQIHELPPLMWRVWTLGCSQQGSEGAPSFRGSLPSGESHGGEREMASFLVKAGLWIWEKGSSLDSCPLRLTGVEIWDSQRLQCINHLTPQSPSTAELASWGEEDLKKHHCLGAVVQR